MLQDIPSQILREPGAFILKTERLTLRQPTLADAQMIAHVVEDKRVAINLRRVPHPYTLNDAIQFVTITAAAGSEIVFLIEHDHVAIGLASVNWDKDNKHAPEIGYCLGVDDWGKGFATEAARAVIDYAFEEFAIEHLRSSARVANPASLRVLEKCGFQWTGVELHRFLALGSSTPVDCFRLERGVWSSLKNWSNSTRHPA